MNRVPALRPLLVRGLLRRCPACGKGPIFSSFLRLRRTCGACGWIVEREPGAVTGAMYLVSVLTLPFAALVAVALWLLTDWPPWLQIVVGLPVVFLFCLIALPVSRGLWVAVEYATDLGTGEAGDEGYRARAFGGEKHRRGRAEEQSR